MNHEVKSIIINESFFFTELCDKNFQVMYKSAS